MSAFVRSCVECQKSEPIPKYRTTLRTPLAGLFDAFSIDFSGPLPCICNGEEYFLLAVKQLTGWSVVRVRTRDTPDVVLFFLKDEKHFTFFPPRNIKLSNFRCFAASRVQTFMDENGIEWKNVLKYAPMNNEKAECMVRSINHSIRHSTLSSGGG